MNYLVYAVLFPAICLFSYGELNGENPLTLFRSPDFALVLLIAYILEMGPALITAVTQALLARRGLPPFLCAIVGMFLTPIPLFFLGSLGSIGHVVILMAVGAFASFVCWLITTFASRSNIKR